MARTLKSGSKQSRFVVVTIILALMASACGGGNDASSDDGSTTTQVETSTTAEAADTSTTEASTSPENLTYEELLTYSGDDRQDVLEAGAAEEGTVVIYTSFVVQPLLQNLIAAFEAKYPDVDVEFFRASDNDLAQRTLTEWQAGQRAFDVVVPSSSAGIIAEGIGAPSWTSPVLEAYPESEEVGRNPSGRWVTVAQYVRGFAYNTELLEDESAVPSDWDDLLNPYWAGRMMWSDIPTVTGLAVGGLVATRGEDGTRELLEGLGGQGVVLSPLNPDAVLDQVIAGAAEGCYCAIHSTDIRIQKDGAALAYAMLGDTYFSTTQSVLLSPEPNNPHAGLLFTDFLLDARQGQSIIQANLYSPVHPELAQELDYLKGREGWVMSPERLEEDGEFWQQLIDEYLR